jgi:hypothetical protein
LDEKDFMDEDEGITVSNGSLPVDWMVYYASILNH